MSVQVLPDMATGTVQKRVSTSPAPKLLADYVPPSSGKINLKVGCEFVHNCSWPTPVVLEIEASRDTTHTLLEESWSTTPEIESHSYIDTFGNRCRRLVLPEGQSTLRYHALVEVSADPDEADHAAIQHPVELLPDETLQFTLASRYCLSDQLSDEAWKLFGNTPPGWARVQAICDWCHENVIYETGSSTPETTVVDVFNKQSGICRDFAHLGVTFCRAMNIPARYCFGYLPDIAVEVPDVAMDFHAWFEAFLDGRWRTFDARHNVPRIGRIAVARGRDAVDCAMITAYGDAKLNT